MDYSSMVEAAIGQTLERFASGLTKKPDDRITLEEAATETVRWLYRSGLLKVIRLMRGLNEASKFDGRDKVHPNDNLGSLVHDVAFQLAAMIRRRYPLVAQANHPAASDVDCILGEFEAHRSLIEASNRRLAGAI